MTPLNLAGFGMTSVITSIIPSSPPFMMESPTVSISTTNQKISWAYPMDNGDTVDMYLINIKDIEGNMRT